MNRRGGPDRGRLPAVAVACVASVLCTLALAFAGSASASAPVVDGHHHVALLAADGVLDASQVESLKERGIQVAVVVLPFERSPTTDLAARITDEVEALRRAAGNGSGFSISNSPAQLLVGAFEGEVQLLLSIEWFGDIFGRDPTRIRRYRDLGVRMIGLAEQGEGPLFEDGSASLTPFGRLVITALNDAGVLIDITHLGHPQKLAVIAASRLPVVATHSLVREVTPVAFNLPNEVVNALAESGGSVWVSFNRSDLLGDGGEAGGRAVEVLADHIDALVARLGHDRVGVGTDLQAAGRYVPGELNSPDTFIRIRHELARRGYSPEQTDGILGGNVLRVLAAAD